MCPWNDRPRLSQGQLSVLVDCSLVVRSAIVGWWCLFTFRTFFSAATFRIIKTVIIVVTDQKLGGQTYYVINRRHEVVFLSCLPVSLVIFIRILGVNNITLCNVMQKVCETHVLDRIDCLPLNIDLGNEVAIRYFC
ncbi:hypothetical protein HanRHA438_Chr13g0613461 [Helianthus annuus]|nr:hypothetical protein HanRHA438_Chr13g0613461 [Helianthus annuus]